MPSRWACSVIFFASTCGRTSTSPGPQLNSAALSRSSDQPFSKSSAMASSSGVMSEVFVMVLSFGCISV